LGLHESGGHWEITIFSTKKMNGEHYHNILHDNLSMSIEKFEKEAKEWCANMITTQSILIGQQSNDSMITNSQYCHGVYKSLT
jgi:hypothetical protein